MSNVERNALTSHDTMLGESLSAGVLAIGFAVFVASWLRLFQWLAPDTSVAGMSLFTALGVALVLMGVAIFALGVASRSGAIPTTPSATAGPLAGTLFGGLGFAIGGFVATQTFGVGLLGGLLGATVSGVATASLTVLPREDLGSTLSAGGLLVLVGIVLGTGIIDASWSWSPSFLSATLPGTVTVPVLGIAASLVGVWSGAKARAGFGAPGREAGAFVLIQVSVFGMLAILALLIGFIVFKGLGTLLTDVSAGIGEWTLPLLGVAIPWPDLAVPFVTNVTGSLFVEVPGVMPAIMGTLWLVVGAVLFAVPLGVGAAVFLTEYAEQGRFTQLVEIATNGLWSTPSIVFGLFGLAFLVPRLGGGKSLVAGQFVLGFMLLPLVVITSRESIKAVPDEYRDASAALGVSKWKTIRSVVLPAAMPGVITGIILGVGRIAGETAPLLLVFGGAPFADSNPGVLGSFEFSLAPPFVTNEAMLSSGSALPYQLYTSITSGHIPGETFTVSQFGWGTALVLLLVVLGLYGIGIGSRLYFRRKLHE